MNKPTEKTQQDARKDNFKDQAGKKSIPTQGPQGGQGQDATKTGQKSSYHGNEATKPTNKLGR
jgi:hypothetical protein